jgi:hypothetical protein
VAQDPIGPMCLCRQAQERQLLQCPVLPSHRPTWTKEGGLRGCLSLRKTVNCRERLRNFRHRRHTVGCMITILSTLVSLLSFRVRSRASLELELELIGLRHQIIVLRRHRPRRLRLFLTDRLFWVWLYRVRPLLPVSAQAPHRTADNRIQMLDTCR